MRDRLGRREDTGLQPPLAKKHDLQTLTAGYLGAAAAGLHVLETWVILLALNPGVAL